MSDYVIAKKSDITNIANVIREKTGLTQGILLNNFSTLLQDMEGAPTDILEMVGADKYAIKRYILNTGGLIEVPKGLTKLNQIKLLIALPTQVNTTVPSSSEGEGEGKILLNYQYEEGKWFNIVFANDVFYKTGVSVPNLNFENGVLSFSFFINGVGFTMDDCKVLFLYTAE